MGIGATRLTLKERGPSVVVPEIEWEALEADLKKLRDVGVVGIRIAGGYRIIEPRQYVGTLKSDTALVEIRPKNPEWFESLQRFLGATIGKTVSALEESVVGAVAHEADNTTALIRAADDAIRIGLPTKRSIELIETSNPVGRILFTESFKRFFSRGMGHKVVCRRFARGYDEVLASVVALCIDLVSVSAFRSLQQRCNLDVLGELMEGHARHLTIAEARTHIGPLRDEYDDWPEVGQLLDVCSVILEGRERVWDIDNKWSTGNYRFCDADRLWEYAVLQSLRAVVRHPFTAEFHPFRNVSTPLLSSGGPDIDPDVVLFDAGRVSVVVDAKNTTATSPVADDVYQIIAYADRLDASAGVLAYISPAETWFSELGNTRRGQPIFAFGIASSDSIRALGTSALRIAAIPCTGV